ncbi:MAG: ComEC/Rec2 family competence protein, partial [Thermoguttaceae bacterium]|nr:ComEC/Rec2 family competence protein [Thermoguttaceae bacterium]
MWRAAFSLTAVAAFAGYRHYSYFNVYPEREIGFYIPKGGVGATVELRLIKTPTVYRNDESSSPIFDQSEQTFFTTEIIRAKTNGNWETFSGKVAVSIIADASELRIGDVIRASGRLATPSQPGNPGERDWRFSYCSQRILATLSIDSAENYERLPDENLTVGFKLARKLENLRLRAAEVLRRELSPRNAAVARAMTFGFRNDVDDATNESFLRSGTVHLLAISGLHIMLVVGMFCWFSRLFGASELFTSVVAVAIMLFYLALTDMRTPVLRAGILIAVVSVATLLRRRAVSLNSLAAAAIFLLLWNPCELFQLGAQLSFLATGTFLWASRSNLRDRAAAADVRRQALRERRKLMGKDAVKTADAAATDNSPSNDESETPAPETSETRGARWRRSAISSARRIRRFVFGKALSLSQKGALIWIV